MRKIIITAIILAIFYPDHSVGQHYKLRQKTNMMGMNMETTIYVKGSRKRTETSGMMGMSGTTTIEQCDLQRTVKLNDKKKLYFIEPFSNDNEEVIDEENSKNKPATSTKQNNPEKGGIVHMYYNITDTGERKKMYGFTARHVWTSQKIKPSPDACMMKDSIMMKTDGWYIDLPQFNCPVRYKPNYRRPNEKVQLDCKDRFITHRRGSGRLGFPLEETTTIIMGNQSQTMQTALETVELSTQPLDSMLFEIPPGYQLAKSEDELQDKMDFKDMMKGMRENIPQNNQNNSMTDEKKPGVIRVGVFKPTGSEQVQADMLQQHMVGSLTEGKVEAIAVNSDADVTKYKCDYTLNTVFNNIKSAGNKIGGLLKAIKNADPNAASSFNVNANLTLKSVSDGSIKSQPSVEGKYEGKVDDAAGRALDDGCKQVLKALR